MRRKFATNLVFLLAANLLVKPFWIFGIDRVVQNRIGPDEYGTYFAVFNYTYLFSIVLDFGINNFNNRAIARNNKRVGEYLLNLMMVKLFLSVIYLAITFLSATATGFNSHQLMMLFFLAINQILLSAILYFRSNIAALQMFKYDSFISILDRLLTIVFCLVLMYGSAFKGSFNIMWFIYAQTAALVITALVALVVVMGRTVIKLNIWRGKFTRMILLKSAPFALLALLMGIYYRIDAVMIERMLPNGAHEAGIYAASFRLLDAVNMFGYLFATLLLPLFAGMIRKRENMQPLVKFSSELMFAGSIIVAACCYFFRNEIMLLLYHNSTPYWSIIFGWLMVSFIPMSSIYIFGTLLTAKGSLKMLNLIALGGVVINVGLNLFLIPAYGALGATFATLITQVFAAVAHVIIANRQFSFVYTPRELAKLVLYTIICVACVFAVRFLPFNWLVNVCIGGLSGIVLIAVFNIVPLAQVRNIITRKATS